MDHVFALRIGFQGQQQPERRFRHRQAGQFVKGTARFATDVQAQTAGLAERLPDGEQVLGVVSARRQEEGTEVVGLGRSMA